MSSSIFPIWPLPLSATLPSLPACKSKSLPLFRVLSRPLYISNLPFFTFSPLSCRTAPLRELVLTEFLHAQKLADLKVCVYISTSFLYTSSRFRGGGGCLPPASKVAARHPFRRRAYRVFACAKTRGCFPCIQKPLPISLSFRADPLSATPSLSEAMSIYLPTPIINQLLILFCHLVAYNILPICSKF